MVNCPVKGAFLMNIQEVIDILDAKVICGTDMQRHVQTACGSDMMSDVLAFVKDQAILLTGLVNPQVVRTADMLDMICVVFVRGKIPTQDIIDLANERDIILLSTNHLLFTACGRLYSAGLSGGCDEI